MKERPNINPLSKSINKSWGYWNCRTPCINNVINR